MIHTGKIVIGFSLVLLSFAMMVSPSGAMEHDASMTSGSGILTLTEPGNPSGDSGSAGFVVLCPRINATYPYER